VPSDEWQNVQQSIALGLDPRPGGHWCCGSIQRLLGRHRPQGCFLGLRRTSMLAEERKGAKERVGGFQ
jgi:hypothetical protein